MANVSYLRTPAGTRSSIYPTGRLGTARRRRRAPWIVGGCLTVVVIVLAVGAFLVASSKPSLSDAPGALAKVTLPLGGGTVTGVTATTGVQNRETLLRVHLTGDPIIVPAEKVGAGERVTVSLVVHRPGWISWLTGKSERLTRTVVTPTTRLRSRYVTLTRSGALRVHFSQAVSDIAYGSSARDLTDHALSPARTTVTIPHRGSAGTLYLAGAVQSWETLRPATLNWFPTGTKATAIVSPAPGRTIQSDTPITLSFSKPVSAVLGPNLPLVSPSGSGSWQHISSHEIRFVPNSVGYGLGAKVTIGLPAGVRVSGAGASPDATSVSYTVPGGSTVRLQQMLAALGYLPFTVKYAGAAPADTLAAQEVAAEKAPAATLDWTYPNTPAGLKSQWDGPANASVLTQGALMKFQFDQDLHVTGFEDTETWNALFQAMVKHETNSFGYTFVSVSEGSPETLFLWHSGKMEMSNILVNTGVPGATTETGTYPVFEHVPVTQMIGTNVNGSHYDDTVHWVSYFHGGDALHYFSRPGYGYPQSNGCVEMNLANAEAVYPYTPVGTIVQVNG